MKPLALRLSEHYRRSLALVLLGVSLSCGPAKPSQLGGADLAGEVVQRAEGYSARPDWANANRPWSRQGDSVRVLGYVAIGADQRIEIGSRAADSYARAELVRFVAVRVVSVLEDQVRAGEPEVLRERIETTARSWVDDLTVAQRYWERRKAGSDEKIHIWSRLDLDQAAVFELLQRATKDAADLRTPVPDLLKKLAERWGRFAEVETLTESDPLLPPDVTHPPWSRSGDRTTDNGFEFVCYGLAKDEKTARALARARCNEKLCRLFGVQIVARSTVVENLDGVTAESEVSEQCANVRVAGRETRYQTSECGPHGCVQWILQSYPRAAYEEEKQRLDKPTVIQQQVVIQEGSKRYRDPAACESSLRSYGAIRGLQASAFEQRRAHLEQAIRVCQGIDQRDSGLFQTLFTLLTQPLPEFTTVVVERNPGSSSKKMRLGFAVASREWQKSLEAMRFLIDRIAAVQRLVNDAILPMRLIDLQEKGGDAKAVEAAISEVVKIPFVNRPFSPHHQSPIHDFALGLRWNREVAYSPRYRDYLLAEASKIQPSCKDEAQVAGQDILGYLAADGQLDAQEWLLGLRMIRSSKLDRGQQCFGPMWDKVNHGGLRAERIDQIAKLIVAGEVKATDMSNAFSTFLHQLQAAERAPLFLRYRTQLKGSDAARRQMVSEILQASFGWEGGQWLEEKKAEGIAQCESMVERIGTFFADVPEAKTSDTGLCMCLLIKELSPAARRGIVGMLTRYPSPRSCDLLP